MRTRARSGGPEDKARRSFLFARLGLRARVTVMFALGALALSAAMAALTYFSARQFSLSQREDAMRQQAVAHATEVRAAVRSNTSSIPALLESLQTAGAMIIRDGTPYPTSFAAQSAVSAALLRAVQRGTASTQIVEQNGAPLLVVGTPLSGHGDYFEVFSLDELSRELDILALALIIAALVTTVAGAALGRFASGRALTPLASVTQAAETIASGRLDTRLAADGDRDLTPFAASFNRMADALQERIEREARFTSDVSHELRSPLTTLAAVLGVLDANVADLPPRSRRALELLGIEVRRFQRMVADLLEISRMDTGSAELSLDEVNAVELLTAAAAASGADAPIDVSPAAARLRLLVDKRRLERVIGNLVENASLYAGGVTRLAVEDGDGVVRLVVADHGPGVALEERQRIFERFYRGQLSGQRGATNGTGLGLSLVSEHVRLHGGRVWVENGAGDETRFVVELPLPEPGRVPYDIEAEELA